MNNDVTTRYYNDGVIHVNLKAEAFKSKYNKKDAREFMLNVILELFKISYKNKTDSEKEKEERLYMEQYGC